MQNSQYIYTCVQCNYGYAAYSGYDKLWPDVHAKYFETFRTTTTTESNAQFSLSDKNSSTLETRARTSNKSKMAETTKTDVYTVSGLADDNASDVVRNETFDYYPYVKVPVYMIATYSLAYSLVFVVGLVGNLLVVLVVFRNPCMRSVTNYFLVNLAMADILVCLFCVPINLMSNLFSGTSTYIGDRMIVIINQSI